MATWMNRKKEDIRNHIIVHGQVLKPRCTPNGSVKQQLPQRACKQSLITDFSTKQTSIKQDKTVKKASAYIFSKGVRRKVSTFEGHDSIESKENVPSPVLPTKKRRKDSVAEEKVPSVPNLNSHSETHRNSIDSYSDNELSASCDRTQSLSQDFIGHEYDSDQNTLDLLASLSDCEKM